MRILYVSNCGECRYVDSLTIVSVKDFERRCFCPQLRDDEAAEFKKDRDAYRTIPDWRIISDWCPLPDSILGLPKVDSDKDEYPCPTI